MKPVVFYMPGENIIILGAKANMILKQNNMIDDMKIMNERIKGCYNEILSIIKEYVEIKDIW
jgi:hypothetical protein